MSEQEKKVHEPSETASVDWAERLKASMNERPDEPIAPTAVPDEEDDLAALLRAQLAKQAASASFADSLDTAEFEEPAEGASDPARETEPEAEPEVEPEKEPEIEPEPKIEPAPAQDIDPKQEMADSIEPLPVPRFTEDDALNGLSPHERVGGRRLQALDEENTRLLRDEGFFREGDMSDTEGSPVDKSLESAEAENASSAESEVPPSAKDRRSSASPAPTRPTQFVHDPMQIGLDDMVTRAEPLPSEAPEEPATCSASARRTAADPTASDYVHRMPHAGGEEELERDTELYLHLGYEDKLYRAEEQARVERVKSRSLAREPVSPRNESSPATKGKEYTSRAQTDAIERAYVRARRQQLVRLLVSLVGLLFAWIYDALPTVLSTLRMPSPFLDSPAYPLAETAWMALVCLPFLSRLGRGIRSLWNFEPTRYAVSAMALAVTAIHSVVACFAPSPDRVPLFGGVALLMLAMAALSEYLVTVGEHCAFSVVSAGKPSYVLTDELTPAAAAYRDLREHATEGADAHTDRDGGETVLSVVRTNRIADYFARTGRYNPYMGRLNYLLPVALLCAIVCAGLAVALGGSLLPDGVRVFTATYLCCLPAAYVIALSLPLCRANGLLRDKGTAVIGAAAPDDYAGKGRTHLLIRDGDALGAVNRKEITLRDDPRVAEWRRMATCLFRILDCPLGVSSPLWEGEYDGVHVEIAETGDFYVRLYMIDDRRHQATEVMMGSHDALVRRGVRLPKITMERLYKKSEESHVIYLAFDRQFRLAYAVEYRVGRTFARAVARLAEMGHTVSVVTYDPLVDNGLLNIPRLRGLPKVDVLRPAYVETAREARSSGVIATGRSLDLLYPFTACRRMKRSYRLGHLLSWLGVLLGLGLSVLSVVSDGGGLLTSSAVAVWQLLLAAVMAFIGLTTVDRKRLFSESVAPKKPDEEKTDASNEKNNTK